MFLFKLHVNHFIKFMSNTCICTILKNMINCICIIRYTHLNKCIKCRDWITKLKGMRELRIKWGTVAAHNINHLTIKFYILGLRNNPYTRNFPERRLYLKKKKKKIVLAVLLYLVCQFVYQFLTFRKLSKALRRILHKVGLRERSNPKSRRLGFFDINHQKPAWGQSCCRIHPLYLPACPRFSSKAAPRTSSDAPSLSETASLAPRISVSVSLAPSAWRKITSSTWVSSIPP